ncbi:MAG TPA: glycosyltransferase family 4 protein [Pyrinomonadaceae bacterium]|nr:glycosyltransferase family 4 protein [Pyrinomonadaceae bacterium]
MRVLHVYSGNLYGGVETLLRTLAEKRDLCPQMEPQFALCFEGRLSQELKSSGTTFHMLGEVRTSRPATVVRARSTLKSLLRATSFDFVICHGAWSQAVFAPAIRAANVSLIFWLHDAARGSHWVERWAKLSRPYAVICNSNYTASTIPHLYSNIPGEIFYCPVEPPPDSLTDRHEATIREELGTSRSSTVIVQVSRMEPWKGHESLLEALALMDDCPDVMCWFVGGAQRSEERSYVASLKQRAQSLGVADRVRFVGERSDVAEILSASDIFCQPNKLPEPFGISFIEALFAGLPVVATALGGAKEIINSSCGLLVDATSPEALAKALRQLVKQPKMRESLGSAGPARASQLCDPFTQLQKLHALLLRFAQHQSTNECLSLSISV